jgi:hypothetical protein
MNVRQTAMGTGNTQITKIFNRPLEVVDICADKLGSLISKISSIDFDKSPLGRLTPPNIPKKNELNCIDAANSEEIEKTYAVWDDLTVAISVDASGKLAAEYVKATFILNTLYLVKFQKDFPAFKLHVITIYCATTDSSSDEAFLLIHLLHYMYLSCQIGIKA